MRSCHWRRLDSTARLSKRRRRVIGPACSRARTVCGYAPGERLVVELQRELNDARGRRRDADRAERAACDVQARNSEVGPVERVEEFGAELEVLRFGQVQVFRQREIEVDQARAAHHADAGGSEHLSLT